MRPRLKQELIAEREKLCGQLAAQLRALRDEFQVCVLYVCVRVCVYMYMYMYACVRVCVFCASLCKCLYTSVHGFF